MTEAEIEVMEAAGRETERLQHELDITNADHIVLWLETNLAEGCGATLAYLACRIIEAHEQAFARHRIAHTAGDVEPVAWMYRDDFDREYVSRVRHEFRLEGNGWTETPLYAHPPAQATTDAEAMRRVLEKWRAYDDCDEADFSGTGPMLLYAEAINETRAILAALPLPKAKAAGDDQ